MSSDWRRFWYLRERLVVWQAVVKWKSDAKRSRRREADKSRNVPAASVASGVHVRRSYVTGRLVARAKNGRVLPSGRLVSRRACRLSGGHRTGRSRRSSPC